MSGSVYRGEVKFRSSHEDLMAAPNRPVDFLSAIPGVTWPAVPKPSEAIVLSLMMQLEASQWWSAETLFDHQAAQLSQVLEHAVQTVPFYAERFRAHGVVPQFTRDPQQWRRIPILKRRDLQIAGDSLHSRAVPKGHGRTSVHITGGSTGEPVRVLTSEITSFAWRVFTLRDHLWHQRNFEQKMAAIRFIDHPDARPPEGMLTRYWGSATKGLIQTGPCAILSIQSSTEQQADWLARQTPGYLLTYPSALDALARHSIEHGWRLPELIEVRSFGEVLEPHVRKRCGDAWGTAVVDTYSSEEFGYLALQCPDGEHYHVQSENVLIEVLDDDDQPCQPGQIGRVVVSGLHNFAMPLVRYEIGDYAEVGPACRCGRGLPVLTRILGRQRNMVTLPNGQTRWPMIEARRLAAVFNELPPIARFQAIQRTLERIDLNLVTARPLSADEEATLRHYVREGLGYNFDVQVHYVDDIPRSPRGKFEEFRSEIQANG